MTHRSVKVLINGVIKPTDLMRVKSGMGTCRDDYRWRRIPNGHFALGRRALCFDRLMFARKYAHGPTAKTLARHAARFGPLPTSFP